MPMLRMKFIMLNSKKAIITLQTDLQGLKICELEKLILMGNLPLRLNKGYYEVNRRHVKEEDGKENVDSLMVLNN